MTTSMRSRSRAIPSSAMAAAFAAAAAAKHAEVPSPREALGFIARAKRLRAQRVQAMFAMLPVSTQIAVLAELHHR
jgi:hypothetical protein